MLEPLLFNIFINDLSLFIDSGDNCNFADENTLFKCCDNLDEAKGSMENECCLVTSWLKNNSLKMNPDKCHVMVLSAKTLQEDFTILVDDTTLIVEDQVTLLGVTIYNKLNSNAHINTICKEVCIKLNVLILITKYLNKNQKKMLINPFFIDISTIALLYGCFRVSVSTIKLKNCISKPFKL